MSSKNICLHCGESFWGRSNKKFCSETHKNQYHYDSREAARPQHAEALPTAPIHRLSVATTKPTLSVTRRAPLREIAPEPEIHEPEEDWFALQEEEEEAEERAVLAKYLHKQYSTLIVKCLKAVGAEQDEEDLEEWIDKFDEVSEAYRSHPALRQPRNVVHERLEDLYWLRDKFQSLQDESAKQASLWFSNEESVYFELSPKRLARLRAHLIA